jgi:ketosteroid isomerase-like protein
MKRIAVLLAVLSLAACEQLLLDKPYQTTPVQYGPATERQVEAASQKFASLMAAQDANAIAGAYAPDGVWERQSGPLRGRDAIRAALQTNTGVRVLSFGMRTELMSYNGPVVVHSGEFQQSVQLPNGKTSTNVGKFEADWIRGPRGEWWIRRMSFRPK